MFFRERYLQISANEGEQQYETGKWEIFRCRIAT